MAKLTAAIVGSGNIGTDLMYKLMRSEVIEPRYMIGVDPRERRIAEGPQGRARGFRRRGRLAPVPAANCLTSCSRQPARTSTSPMRRGTPSSASGRSTSRPLRSGRSWSRRVNIDAHLDAVNLNMVTCAGQATIPIVHAVAAVTEVDYAEIVATVASVSAGPGTRANIDEFTRTTSRAIAEVWASGSRQGDHRPQSRRSAADHA